VVDVDDTEEVIELLLLDSETLVEDSRDEVVVDEDVIRA